LRAVLRLAALALSLAALLSVGCDRRVEPYVPGEQPATPDLARIFPPQTAEPEPPTEAPSLPPPPPGAARRQASAAGAPIRGTIEVAPELAQRVPAGASLFVFARGAGGGPPIAAKRIEAPRFPLAFQLGPEDQMGAGRSFEGPLQVSARLDADGNATTRSAGDLQGDGPTPVEPGASGVSIVLDQVL
jgi:cytochrome c-type biogenesis protein CcmH